MTVSFPSSKHIQSSSGINLTSDRKAEVAHLLAGNVQLNKGRKQDFKRMKRERKKAGNIFLDAPINLLYVTCDLVQYIAHL